MNWYSDSDFTQLYNWNNLVESDITLYAKWNIRNYVVTINSTSYGTVSTSSVTKPYETEIVIDGNKVTIGDVEVTATPSPSNGNYVYKFDSWTNNCGDTLTSPCTIKANFSSQVASATFMP